ncbi:hypothetical protein ONZ45_g14441 [Pleurotus djamor]|nr:hypothetical protein ONZ45_g14441 [Pleurotus djamor]
MGNKSALKFLKQQLATVPPVVKADLSGRTVLVVGANAGIGFELAKHFARLGAGRLLMGCRSQQRGDEAVKRLGEETGYDRAELWLVDLASFDSVKAFAEKFNQEVERLDILVANAAVIPTTYQETIDGWETSIQVNHISPALLIFLLLPKLMKTLEAIGPNAPSPRVVIVASEVHQYAKVPKKALEASSVLEAIGSKELSTPYDDFNKYNLAKLLNVCFARALQSHLPASSPGLIVNSVNPGFCHSNIRRSMYSPTGRRPFMLWLMETFLARTAEEGARQLAYASLALQDQVNQDKMRGAYVDFAEVVEPGDFVISSQGKEFQDMLWNDTLRVLNKLDDRVQPTVDKYLTK